MIRIQPLRVGLSTLRRFIPTWIFEAHGLPMFTVKSISAFMILPQALTPEHYAKFTLATVVPGFGVHSDTKT